MQNTSKTLTYSSFALASLLVVAAFLTARSYTQLTIAVILFPALAYFALRIFPRRAGGTPAITIQMPVRTIQRTEEIRKEKVDVVDLDKRTFLKLLGTVGVSVFLFSLLGKKVESLLFGGSLAPTASPPQNTSNVGTSQAGPTAGYNVAEIDENVISYYGFTNQSGGWLIMREDTQANSFRYAKGNSNFPLNWANRADLKYDYYYNLF